MLPADEKVRLMEVLWGEMQARYDTAAISPELLTLLRHRQDRVASGEAKLLEWDLVKGSFGRG